MRKVIIDRAYSVTLLAFISEISKQRTNVRLDRIDSTILSDTVSALAKAAVLYDKLLIEQSFSSSLDKMLMESDHNWFWDIFEPIDLQTVDLGVDENLIVEDDFHFDLKDGEFRKKAKYYCNNYSPRSSIESAIRYINLCVKGAKGLNADIMPWPSRFDLFNYKFRCDSLFPEGRSGQIFDTILELDFPQFKIHSFLDLVSLRNDDKIRSLRTIVDNIHIELNSEADKIDKLEIIREYIAEHRRLIDALSPTKIDKLQMAVSWFVPFPFNALLDTAYSMKHLNTLRKFKWFFCLTNDPSNTKTIG